MGDTIPLDWGAANTPAPNPVNAFMQAFQQGRSMGLQRTGDEALQEALHNPNDIAALTKLSVYNPDAAKSMFGALDYQRHVAQREAGANLFQAYAMPQANAFTPQPQSPQGALPPVAPGASFDQAMAPVGAPGQPAPQAAGAQQQSSPLSDPAHPVAQQIGQAAVSGRPIDPARAWAALAAQSDPAEIEKYQTAIASMDKMRLSRLADANDALGAEAQNLLKVPQDQRAGELQRLAPMLMQHGITQEQLQGALQTGLSDTYLQGIVGQALGTKGLLDQQNTQAKLGFEGQRVGIEQQNADTNRISAVAGAQGTGINDGYGHIINNRTGQVMYGNDMPGGGDGSFAPQATAYATALKKQGLPDNVVAGIMGNLHVESGFDPSRVGDGGLAQGVAQWHPDRAAQFKAQFGVTPSQGSPDQVAAFIKREIGQLPPSAQQAILNAQTPQAAAAAFDQYYERSDGKARSARMQAAANWANTGGAAGAGGMSADAIKQAASLGIDKFGGQVPPGFARNKAAMAAVANEISRQMAATGTTTRGAMAGAAAVHADAGAVNTLEKQATIVRAAEGAAQKNADLALSLAPKVANGNIQIFNAWKNHWKTSMGDPAVASFAAALDTFSLEYAKVMGGGSPTVSGQEHARGLISSSQSPQQLQGVIRTLKKDMENRRAAYQDERNQTLGRIAGTGGGAHPADISAIMSKYGH